MKRFCVICGKELDIILGEKFTKHSRTIISGGYFFISGRVDKNNPKNLFEQKEYWECEECNND